MRELFKKHVFSNTDSFQKKLSPIQNCKFSKIHLHHPNIILDNTLQFRAGARIAGTDTISVPRDSPQHQIHVNRVCPKWTYCRTPKCHY